MSTDRLPGWSTYIHEAAGDPGGCITVAVTDRRTDTGDQTIIVAQGFKSWIETFELQRFQLIARTLRARLVIAETPGLGAVGSRLLPGERRALVAGDFGPVATRMFAAAVAELDGESDLTLSFLGYSMGASIVTTMMKNAAAQGWAVNSLVLVEPVTLQKWKILPLIAAASREARWTAEYLATNNAVDGALAPWHQRAGVRPATRRRLDLLVLGAAIRRGALTGDLHTVVPPRQVIIVRGDRSELSRARSQATLTALRERGVVTAELSVPGHHAFWHSLPAVQDMARRLKTVLDRLGPRTLSKP